MSAQTSSAPDAMGGPEAAAHWNQDEFLDAIGSHLLKSNDYTALDLTGFNADQVSAVNNYLVRCLRQVSNALSSFLRVRNGGHQPSQPRTMDCRWGSVSQRPRPAHSRASG